MDRPAPHFPTPGMVHVVSARTLRCIVMLNLFATLASGQLNGGRTNVERSGVKPQVISLPKGPGSIEGLGASFEPQLNTGTVTYRVELELQPGRNGFAPEIALAYNGGNGNGPLGLGWSLSIPSIQRQTDKGFPNYDAADVFLESGGEELVPLDNSTFRQENETAFTKYERSGDGWVAHLRSGVRLEFGLAPSSQIRREDRIFKWLIESGTDTNDNRIHYEYQSLDNTPQKYLSKIVFSELEEHRHEVEFRYEARPDVLTDYRATFNIETAFRCTSISMKTDGELVRRYDLGYIPDADLSLLASITQIGSDGVSSLPPAEFTYTVFDDSQFEIRDILASAPGPLFAVSTDPDATLNDMNADALPDLLVARPGDHQVYFNLGVNSEGQHLWSPSQEMGVVVSPGDALGDVGASLADINGDGRTDFIARQSADTYFLWPNLGDGTWGAPEIFDSEAALPIDFEDPGVRLLDADNNKRVDVLFTEDAAGESYRYFLNRGGEYQVSTAPGLGDAMTFDQRPGMKLADMNGDRLQDIVLLQDGNLQYWPMSGPGTWDLARRGPWLEGEAGTGTKMVNPPSSQDDAEPGLAIDWPELLLLDVNGDGLSDVVYLPFGAERIVFWLNCNGLAIIGPFQIQGVPVKVGLTTVFPADINGNGTVDLLWNYPEDSDVDPSRTWRYLDFAPAGKPYLLKTAGNGIGGKTNFFYRTTTVEQIRDQEADQPWPEGVPNPVSVLGEFTLEDGLGESYRTEIRYHDGYFDARRRSFAASDEWNGRTWATRGRGLLL